MALLTILLKMLACSGILYGYYWLFLRNKKFHHYNRFFLLSIVIVSLVFPFIRIPILFHTAEQKSTGFYQVVQTLSVDEWENEEIINTNDQSSLSDLLTVDNLVILVAITGIIWMLFQLLSSIKYIQRIRIKYPSEKLADLQLYHTNEPGTPFSFFRSIFWNNDISFNSVKGQQIFRHELFHVRQSHSADNLFMEIVCCVAWFNPVFFLIRRELKTVHEFLADQYSVSESNRYEYAELLLQESIRLKTNPLVQPFFHSQIKRRIAMITKIAHRKYGYASRVLVLPILVLLFLTLVVKAQKATQDATNSLPEIPSILRTDEPITIIVDAGHGGEIAGARGSLNGTEYFEKDLTLQIAQKIKAISERYNVKVIMVRESDLKIPNQKRVEMAENNTYDALVSIHINAQAPKKVGNSYIPRTTDNGIEVYVSARNKNTLDKSSQLARTLIQSLNLLYKTLPTVKQREYEGIYILDKPSKPSVMVECGYITNPEDLEFMLNETNQEKIAEKILEGIVGFSQLSAPSKAQFVDPNKEVNSTVKGPHFEELVTTEFLPKEVEHSIIRNYLKSIRYPDSAKQANYQANIYFSVDINSRGELSNPIVYNTEPEHQNQFFQELVTVSYTKPGEEIRMAIPAFHNLFVKEVTRINKDLKPIKSTETIKAQRLFFKAVFVLQRDVKETNDPYKRTFTKTEIPPQYPGGINAWNRFLEKNGTYPTEAKKDNISGLVILQFVVNEEGEIEDISQIEGHGLLGQEAIRLLKLGGKWSPAEQNGHKVRAYAKLAFNFNASQSSVTGIFDLNNDPAQSLVGKLRDSAQLERNKQIKEVIALSRAENKAAYHYKGRTYIFAKIDPTQPSNINSYFEQTDGRFTQYVLNGKFINSIEDINARFKRSEIKSLKMLFKQDAKVKYGLDETVLEIETF